MRIETWEDLAEKSIFFGLSEDEIYKLGLRFKSGKTMVDLIQRTEVDKRKHQGPFTHHALVQRIKDAFKEYLEGNLSDDHEL